jgi:molecular chaperone DnaJ
MAKKDYYEILGLKKDANGDEIKKAYRKLAKTFHPDKNPGDSTAEEKFKEISEAYEHLSDSNKKAKYDQFGHNQHQDFGRRGYSGGFDFGGSSEPQPRFGIDKTLLVKLTLDEIYFGITKKFKYKRTDKCDDCHGHGGTDIDDCGTCNGSGVFHRVMNTPIGHIRQTMVCPNCSGIGRKYKNACNTCKESGLKTVEEVIEIEIPSGVQEGMAFVMNGKGDGIKSGENGDLIINIQELPHNTFTRFGNDLKMILKLNYPQLVLGDKVELETIDGKKIRVDIPKYSEVGANLRIPTKGMKFFKNSNIGDLIISLGISIPKDIDSETETILNNLKEKIEK